MVARQEVEQEVKNIIAGITGLPADKITPEANFVDDLGIESIVAIDVVSAVESKYSVEIPEEKYGEFDCLKSAVDIVCQELEQK